MTVHTCKIVSKLNVSPFHRVNSPLDAPVIKRRPSGVHFSKTGKILFSVKGFKDFFFQIFYMDAKYWPRILIQCGSYKLGGYTIGWIFNHILGQT